MNAAAASVLPRLGERVGGKYVLRRVLGEGGMGTVLLAEDETLGREVAIKFLHARGLSSDRLVRGLRREARPSPRWTTRTSCACSRSVWPLTGRRFW